MQSFSQPQQAGNMLTLGGIDIGSNAMRLIVGHKVENGKLEILNSFREPVRLGHDVFGSGLISAETTERALQAFSKFRTQLDHYEVNTLRAVATSAMREANNREAFVDWVSQAYHINIEVISAEEEARLVHLAVDEQLNLGDKRALIIDIGGGSVEVMLIEKGSIKAIESLGIGTVRLMNMLNGHGSPTEQVSLMREYIAATKQWLIRQIGSEPTQVCIGVGGNVEALGDLRCDLLGKDDNTLIQREELDEIYEHLIALSYEDRIRKLGLRPDRADVIIPATLALQSIMKQAHADRLEIPDVGVKEGLLLDLANEANEEKTSRQKQVMVSALELGRKYEFDENHGTNVAVAAVRLFDQTHKLHKLGKPERLLLEVAALLHDIGHFVSNSEHHKHAYYILSSSPIIGLSTAQMEMVANIARYHRKAFPNLGHKPFRYLPHEHQQIVEKLSALLRLATAMDAEHEGRVQDFQVQHKSNKFNIHLEGKGDLLLEKWALLKRCALFEQVYKLEFAVKD